jgi:hypothetical protein
MAPSDFVAAHVPVAPAPAVTAAHSSSASSQWQVDALNSALSVPLAVRRAAAAAKHLVASEVSVVAGAAEESLRCVQSAAMAAVLDASQLTLPAPAFLQASRPAPEPPIRRSSMPQATRLRITLTAYDDSAVPLSTIAIPLTSLPRQSWPEKVEHRQAMPASCGPHASFGWDGRPIADRRCLFPAPIDSRGRGMDGGRCWSRRGLGYEVVRATPMRFADSRGRSTTRTTQQDEASRGAPLQRCNASTSSFEPMPNPHEAKPIAIAVPSVVVTAPSESVVPYSPRTHARRSLCTSRLSAAVGSNSSNASFLPAGTVACVEMCPSAGTQPRMKLSIRSTSPTPAVQAEVARVAAVFDATPSPTLSQLPAVFSSDEEDSSLDASSEHDADDDDSESELPYTRQRMLSTSSDATASSSASSSEDSELETESDDTDLSSEYDCSDDDEGRPHKTLKISSGGEKNRKRKGYGSSSPPYSALRRLAAAAAAGRRGAVCSLPEALDQAWQAPLLMPLAPSEKRARTPFALGDESDADSSADAEGETDEETQPPGAFFFHARRNALRIA